MSGLRRHLRRRSSEALIWCGFAVLLVLATQPVWSRLIFGFQPTLNDLLSLRCFS